MSRHDDIIDEFDAAIFTGDAFRSEEALSDLETALARWQREAQEIRQSLVAEAYLKWEKNNRAKQ